MIRVKYIFYPGCNAEQVEKEALDATYAVCRTLGIELIYADNFSCCGATHADKVDRFLNLLINARNLAYAAKSGLPVMTICNTCYLVMKRVQHQLRNEEETLQKVNRELSRVGLQYKHGVEVKHFYEVLYDDLDVDLLKEKVIRPLDMIKAAPFYGCHMLRPEAELGVDSLEAGAKVDEIIKALGAQVVNHENESACCGFHVTMANPDLCAKMNGKNLLTMKQQGADVVVTPCTLCHTVMDGQQHRAEKSVGQKIGLPVLHLPQLVGFALGIDGKTLGLGRHIVSCKALLSKILYESSYESPTEVNDDGHAKSDYGQSCAVNADDYNLEVPTPDLSEPQDAPADEVPENDAGNDIPLTPRR